MMRACWCAQSELQPFSADYDVCLSCRTLISRFHHDRNVARVSSDDSDLYGSDYGSATWRMTSDLRISTSERART